MTLLKHPFPIPLLQNLKYTLCPGLSNFFKLQIIKITAEVVKALGRVGEWSQEWSSCHLSTRCLPERRLAWGLLSAFPGSGSSLSCLGHCHPKDSQVRKGCRERKKEGKGVKREEGKRKPR